MSFNNLTDLTDLIGVRYEDDYECVLLKEKRTGDTRYLQIIGSMDVVDPVSP